MPIEKNFRPEGETNHHFPSSCRTENRAAGLVLGGTRSTTPDASFPTSTCLEHPMYPAASATPNTNTVQIFRIIIAGHCSADFQSATPHPPEEDRVEGFSFQVSDESLSLYSPA